MTAGLEAQEPEIFSKTQHSLSIDEVDSDAMKIIRRLDRHGYKAFVVGGGVRDLYLRKVPKDFDIATDATPRQIKALFRNCRIIGRRFKLAHIYFRGNKIIEVSTFRDVHDAQEQATDDLLITRDNVYGSERTDAVRRDLTINGLFFDPLRLTIIDYVGGMQDLKDGIVRIIGDADVRLAEDPVRMIRALRHAARAGFVMDTACSEAISKNNELILQCVPMRLYEELKKDFSSGHIVTILQLLREYELLEHFLPFLANTSAAHLWEPGSFFLDVLSRIDTVVSSADTPDLTTAILAVLSLFYAYPHFSSEAFIEERITQQRFKEMTDDAFAQFAVPRKEKEKIVILLRDIQTELLQAAGQKVRKRKRSNNKASLQVEKEYALYFLELRELPQTKKRQVKRRSRRPHARRKDHRK